MANAASIVITDNDEPGWWPDRVETVCGGDCIDTYPSPDPRCYGSNLQGLALGVIGYISRMSPKPRRLVGFRREDDVLIVTVEDIPNKRVPDSIG